MLKSSCLLGFALIGIMTGAACKRSRPVAQAPLSAKGLEASSLRFMQKTRLVGSTEGSSGPSSGTFNPSPWPVSEFWPATPLVLPAQAAAYINQTYAASIGFTYQSFTFNSTGCNGGDAFARYISAIEALRGGLLNAEEREQIESAFSSSFNVDTGSPLSQFACMIYDLMACIGDYAMQNQTIFQEAAQSGDFASVLKGAMSCIGEVTGMDPTDGTDPDEFEDPFDPDTSSTEE